MTNEERTRYLLDEVWSPGECPPALMAWVSENVLEAIDQARADLMVRMWVDNSEPIIEVTMDVGQPAGADPWRFQVSLWDLVKLQDEDFDDNPQGLIWRLQALAEMFDGHAAKMRGLADRMMRDSASPNTHIGPERGT